MFLTYVHMKPHILVPSFNLLLILAAKQEARHRFRSTAIGLFYIPLFFKGSQPQQVLESCIKCRSHTANSAREQVKKISECANMDIDVRIRSHKVNSIFKSYKGKRQAYVMKVHIYPYLRSKEETKLFYPKLCVIRKTFTFSVNFFALSKI